MIRYELPQRWLNYHPEDIYDALVDAKAAIQALKSFPFQRSWVERLQEIQLKREVAGTSRIEGAEFTERELDAAMRPQATAAELISRSQRQAHAAMQTYRWLAIVPNDRPFTSELLSEIHRKLVTGCDDDHCPPGVLRGRDHNVTFGIPMHRGVEGGPACEEAVQSLLRAFQGEFREADTLIQSLAMHYHLAAMHPFIDGNGRTARAVEALLLGRAGLSDRAFIAMSNFYYDEKPEYLRVLSETRAAGHNLTPFILFGLRGIRRQAEALTVEILKQMQRALFRDTMYNLFNRLQSKRKRVIQERQIEILKLLIEADELPVNELIERTKIHYISIKGVTNGFIRDLTQLIDLQAVRVQQNPQKRVEWIVSINLDWPQEIDESEFLRRMKEMPKASSFKFLS